MPCLGQAGVLPGAPALRVGGAESLQCRPCFGKLLAVCLCYGSKPVRRKANNKVLATSGGTGRSPLSILQDDNSPSAPTPRQVKRHALGENFGEKKEVTVDLSRSLKSGNCTWSDLNKENQHCPFVEN
ncbi:PREDICTED: cell division cycle-associated protein 3 [Apaloderma vittatum]|uniref:cell division cycle-associated protein 3 n=1 Tax=Apaloderma vittatum TaxID=57397 RepID=UPI000521723B|nr:PREDICTED: cell division cycle-associated protein 3 [Apaloderma vittatum]